MHICHNLVLVRIALHPPLPAAANSDLAQEPADRTRTPPAAPIRRARGGVNGFEDKGDFYLAMVPVVL